MIPVVRVRGVLQVGPVVLAVLLLSAGVLHAAEVPADDASGELARQILDAAGVRGGLIVQLGCGDGRLTAALKANEACVVHGLDADAASVDRARSYVRSRGLYGGASVERLDGPRLPYVDNLVNLVVAEQPLPVSREEMLRVLAPGGVAYLREGGRWTKTVKPLPGNTDEWTHYLHDASGNAVAHDQLVGPPHYLQWTAQPRHTRSHEHIPSIYAVVSTAGRIFYIADQGPVSSVKQSPRWQLVARDAYNGMLLWERAIGTWYPHIVNWGRTPRQLQRKLVAVGDRVYVTLGLHAPLSALDAATGRVLNVYEGTEGTEEIVLHEGVLLLVVRSVTQERIDELKKWARLIATEDSPVDARESAEPLVARLRAAEATGEKTLLALDAESGRVLWKKVGQEVPGLRTASLCAAAGGVFHQNGRDTICRDLKSGRERWSAQSLPLRLVWGESVFCAGGTTASALSVETGKTRWTRPTLLVEVRDLFVAGGSVWVGGFKPCPGKRGPSWGPYFATQLDPATGEMLRHIEPVNPGHHHRCYWNKATDRYILGGRRGTEFIDLASGEVLWNSWARGVCRYGVMPCNGLLYAPPHACGCYMAAKLTGFNAMAATRDEGRGAGDERLQKGAAFTPIPNPQSLIPNPSDWPTYRHDAQRSGSTPCRVPSTLRHRWQVDLGGRLSSPTVAGDKVFVADVDGHGVVAIAVDSGQPLWRFTAGGRVDSPPTLHRGRWPGVCRQPAKIGASWPTAGSSPFRPPTEARSLQTTWATSRRAGRRTWTAESTCCDSSPAREKSCRGPRSTAPIRRPAANRPIRPPRSCRALARTSWLATAITSTCARWSSTCTVGAGRKAVLICSR